MPDADRGYDSDNRAGYKAGHETCHSTRKNRTKQRPYDENLYKIRHLVENTFLHLKRWRGIATRYAKNSASFLAAIQIRCTALWLNIS